ncbi:MAG TPA: hypothetical protein VHV78_17100 [Gemmatimonadaceae bacterium]|nr:hypothetical protein [Gemmatimonadaceae bacterium]
MNQPNRTFPELARRLDHFTTSTRTRLSRSLVHALRGRPQSSRSPLDDAIGDACRELRAEGLDDRAIVAFLGGLVEETGRACGADRPSLISGQLRWMPVRLRVLELVSGVLALPAPPLHLAMDHANGLR